MTRERKPQDDGDRLLVAGRPDYLHCDNSVQTSKYTVLSFFPVAIAEQFRRFANVYFLIVGIIMSIGFFTDLWETAVSPFTIFGPLCLVISFSLLVEGAGDVKRHKNDDTNNSEPCVVLHRISRNDHDEENAASTNNEYSEHTNRFAPQASMIFSPLDSNGNPTNNINNNNDKATDPTTTTKVQKKANKMLSKFRRGIDIHRDKSINDGDDVYVPLLPSILEGNNSDTLECTDMTSTAAADNNNNSASMPPVRTQSTVCFQSVQRQNIRQGQFVLVKNREMIPADIILVASSADHGSAYIETSSIDGETNLKLRSRAPIPAPIQQQIRQWRELEASVEKDENNEAEEDEGEKLPSSDEELLKHETLEQAVKRVTRCSALGNPLGLPISEHPMYKEQMALEMERQKSRRHFGRRGSAQKSLFLQSRRASAGQLARQNSNDGTNRWTSHLHFPHLGSSRPTQEQEQKERYNHYVATLTSEPPNPHVHTFSGKLTIPSVSPFSSPSSKNAESNDDAASSSEVKPYADVPLGAEHMLLRGAVLRNTEWVIGMVCFTGVDTKLVQNSFETPSKLSQLDRLMNWTVVAILALMTIIIVILASLYVVTHNSEFDELWYLGFHRGPKDTNDTTYHWPYLPDLEPPEWETKEQNWIQMFFLFLTLLNNIIPMSLYVTVEFLTFAHQWFINVDQNMYDDTTNTRAVARSTNVTDLGRVQYIFSDKTGTLTQNVMRFKRCSVNGFIWGAPITMSSTGVQRGRAMSGSIGSGGRARSRSKSLGATKPPGNGERGTRNSDGDKKTAKDEEDSNPNYFPLAQLLDKTEPINENEHSETGNMADLSGNTLTFNAEMFLRVMSLCHTVVVEKDLDLPSIREKATKKKKLKIKPKSKPKSLNQNEREHGYPPTAEASKNYIHAVEPQSTPTNTSISLGKGTFDTGDDGEYQAIELVDTSVTKISFSTGQNGANTGIAASSTKTGVDGAPLGFAYQAESPDEGALVSAASLRFGYQVIGRDSSGIQIQCHEETGRSIFENASVVQALKEGNVGLSDIAAKTAMGVVQASGDISFSDKGPRVETWSILAVNKFDSDRKRMSILLRSPPELGGLPILFCKGADVAMIDPEVSIVVRDDRDVSLRLMDTSEKNDAEPDETEQWEIEQFLELEMHLGDFAREGLRTLVLGMRVLDEDECQRWLTTYKKAATSMKNRDELMTAAAKEIETRLYIVGATAIEDKLQKEVPKTIANLSKAGIKIWVLTGDKRETAVEIGYSTHVLTPQMHVTQVPDVGAEKVRTKMAMEFMRQVKSGSLRKYQRATLNAAESRFRWENFIFRVAKMHRRFTRFLRKKSLSLLMKLGLLDPEFGEDDLNTIAMEEVAELKMVRPAELRRNVRKRAEAILEAYLQAHKNQGNHRRLHSSRRSLSQRLPDRDFPSDNLSERSLMLEMDDVPMVFNRAAMSKRVLVDYRLEQASEQGRRGSVRHAIEGINQIQHLGEDDEDDFLVEEDCLSQESVNPEARNNDSSSFDKRKRTSFERLFAVDKHVRHGMLEKHLYSTRRVTQKIDDSSSSESEDRIGGSRALVIEGAALKHMFGDAELEELLFAVASNCDAIIACRVSPKQKAQLVNLVRCNVVPEPVTLAIGDGANDVGMIQEAHVGVGISGKEGQQAVNASDFAIAQFRFLEELVLIHGRWNFFRMSTVVLFQFYKNSVMAGCLILFTGRTLFSGVSLFDEWSITLLNFVSAIPIFLLGAFDRCLSKSYVRRHPEVFKPARENELVTFRILLRWVCLVFIHCCILYFGTVYELSQGGGITSAFEGLMDSNEFNIGDGEGGDLRSVGAVTFTCLVFLLAYKVLYESRSLIHGRWPALAFWTNDEEGVLHRLAYTWWGVAYFSIGLYFFIIVVYNLAGREFLTFSDFVNIAFQVMETRSLVWLLILFVPIVGIAADVMGKIFSNMYFPTQTQIHLELEYKERRRRRKHRRREHRIESENTHDGIASASSTGGSPEVP